MKKGFFANLWDRLFGEPAFKVTPWPPLPPLTPSPPVDPATFQNVLLDHHNALRAARGVHALVLDPRLVLAAEDHAAWMALNRNMTHLEKVGTPGFTGQAFGDRVKANGYAMANGGENAAAGQKTPRDAADAWAASPDHLVNIVSEHFAAVGFGVGTDANGARYWCAVFASPLSVYRVQFGFEDTFTYPAPVLPPALVDDEQ